MAGKRAAWAMTQASKRARVGREEQCKVVADAMGDVDLPRTVREMLARMVPKALGVPADERGPEQAAVVGMLERSLDEHQARMQSALADLEERRGASEEQRVTHEEALKSAESTLAARKSVVEEKRDSLAEITLEVRAAKQHLAAAEEAKTAGEVGLKEAEQERAELVRLRDGSYEPFKAGSSGSPVDITLYQVGLEKLARVLNVPASLKTALPGVAGKPPADRGTFDVMVLDQFEAELARRLSALEETLAIGAPAAAEREAVVAAAGDALQARKERQRTAAHAQREAESGEEGTAATMASLMAAQHALRDFVRGMATVDQQLAQQQAQLEFFGNGVLAPFRQLRDPPAEPPASEEAIAEAEVLAAEAPAVEEPRAEESGTEN